MRWETTLRKGVCDVSFDRQDIAMNKFAAACLESHCYVFDARTQHETTGAQEQCPTLVLHAVLPGRLPVSGVPGCRHRLRHLAFLRCRLCSM